ncbi:LPXTG cell wall anchor domain-containing protein [Lactiplantibacillus plantarum]|uniref:LPXTG cell wall anchor domain-containing protein n=1 Tax=Lactiplantibacillus plantarum TaxID=1590 RepID=UPI00207363F2|nr:LPXTG cell wall anchor domain-containing protein [Lactiplantibacillus plantarum]
MSKNNLQTPLLDKKQGHYKMFKVNKVWIFASATLLSMAGTSIIGNTNAHADNTNLDSDSVKKEVTVSSTPSAKASSASQESTAATTTANQPAGTKAITAKNSNGSEATSVNATSASQSASIKASVATSASQATNNKTSNANVSQAAVSIAKATSNSASDATSTSSQAQSVNNSQASSAVINQADQAKNASSVANSASPVTSKQSSQASNSQSTTTQSKIEKTQQQAKDRQAVSAADNKTQKIANDLATVKSTVNANAATKLAQTSQGDLKVFVQKSISKSDLASLQQALANYQEVSGKSVEIEYDDQLATKNNVVTPTTREAAVKALVLSQTKAALVAAKANDSGAKIANDGKTTTITPSDSALQQAIATAKANGITVKINSKSSKVDKTAVAANLNRINNDYQAQLAQINKTVSDYAARKAIVDEKKKEYQAQLAAYEKKLADTLKANEVDTSNLVQNLVVNKEPTSHLTITNLTNGASVTKDKGRGNSHSVKGFDSTYDYIVLLPNKQVNGVVATATFTNLKKSYYTDANGRKHNIVKIVENFKNSQGYNAVYGGKTLQAQLSINNDASDGFWYDNMHGVDCETEYYDENNNRVNIKNGLGYLTVSSLNAGNQDVNGKVVLKNGHSYVVERAQGIENAVAKQLHGSSVTVHKGNLAYSETTNEKASTEAGLATTSWKHTDRDWDVSDGPDQYFGAVVYQISGDSNTIRYSTDTNWPYVDCWAISSTVLPESKNVKPTPPKEIVTPTLEANLESLVVDTPAVTNKVADNENKLVLAGQKMTQHISATTGLVTSDQFVLGDNIYFSNGKLPVSVNVSDLHVVRGDKNSTDDQSGLFNFNVNSAGKDSKGNTVYQVSVTAKDPSKLGTGVTYTLNMVETSNIDHVADDDSDTGYSLVNGTYTETSEHTYHEWTPTTTKDWVEGNQVVNGKTYIDGDTITGALSMNLPDQSKLTQKLSKIQLIDDLSKYYKLADLTGYDLFENGTNVDSLYSFSDDGQGHYTLLRKDASTTPAGTLTFIGHWKLHSDVATGTQIINGGSGTIDNDTVPVTPVKVVTYHPEANKHWTSLDGKTITDGKTYVAGDQVAFEVNAEIPNNLAANLKHFQINDDYSEKQLSVDITKARAFDNGIDITSLGKFVDNNGVLSFVVTDKANLAKLTAGPVQLKGYGTLLTTLKNGDTIPNHGGYTLNNVTVDTNVPNIYVYSPQPVKNWVEGNQVVNGKTYIDGDNISASLSMELPDQEKLNTKLTKVSLTDDFSKSEQYADFTGYDLFENGKDAKSLYSFSKDSSGHYTLTRNDANTTPSGVLTFIGHWKLHADVPSGTKIANSGSGTINDDTVPVTPVDVVPYHPEANKHWTSLDGNTITDGKTYVAGDQVAFEVNAEIPNNLAANLKHFQINDDYSEKQLSVDITKARAFDNGIDITSLGRFVDNNGVLSFIVTDKDNLSKLTAGPVHLKGYGTLLTTLKNGDTIPNHGSYTLNNVTVDTNIPNIYVYAPQPVKHWTDDQGKTTDNQMYLAGDTANASVTVTYPDQSKMANHVANIGIYDDYSASDKYVTLLGADVTENGKNVTSEYNFVRSNGLIVATRKDPTKAPNNAVTILVPHFKINADAPANFVLSNVGGAIINNDKVPTPPANVTTWRDTPEKDVEVGVVEGDSSATANGMTVVKGTTITYPLSAKDLPANRETTVTKEVRHDKLPDGVQYTGYKAYLKQADGTQKDVSNFYNVTVNGQDITVTGTQALFDYYNANKSAALVRPVVDLYGTVTKDGATLVNKYTLTTNDDTDDSNEVTIYTPTITPTKEVHNITGADINGKNIARGDLVKYTIYMDLTNLKNVAATKDQLAKGISVWDAYDKSRVRIDPSDIHIFSPDGKTDLGKLFKITNDSVTGKFTVQTNSDVLALLKQYGGYKLPIQIVGHVLKDVTGDLSNTAFQDTFGEVVQTNTVINHIPQMNPSKDVVVNVGNQKSLNGKTIKLGDVFDYKLKSSGRSANYGGSTSEWSIKDTLSDKDDYTGQYQVYATHDFVLSDGTKIEKGTDITEYFTSVYNPTNNQVQIKAKNAYLDIINSDANKANSMGWVAYVQCKRVGTGTVFNVFQESYNNETINSNVVKTTTPEAPQPVTPTPAKPEPKPTPEKPTVKPAVTPAKPAKKPAYKATPTPTRVVAKPVAKPQPVAAAATPAKVMKITKPAPAAKAKSLPQTGEHDDTAMAMLGAAGLIFLLGSAKLRKKQDA